METDEGIYHATPQIYGRIAHETVDEKRTSNRTDELQSLPIIIENKEFSQYFCLEVG